MNTSVTVTTSAQRILPQNSTAATQHRQVVLLNTGTNTVYVGDADVTSSNGFPIAQDAALTLDFVSPYTLIYARTASGTSDLRILEVQ